MTKSKRLNRSNVFAGPYDGEPVQISDEQFEGLEYAGKRVFNSTLRETITRALYFFTVSRDMDRKASTREQEYNQLTKVQEAIKTLNEFFSAGDIQDGAYDYKEWHTAHCVRWKLHDALVFPERTDNGGAVYEPWRDFLVKENRPKRKSVYEIKESIEQNPGQPVIDLDDFQKSVSWLDFACTRAMAIFNAECSNDQGAPETDEALPVILRSISIRKILLQNRVHYFKDRTAAFFPAGCICAGAVTASDEGPVPVHTMT